MKNKSILLFSLCIAVFSVSTFGQLKAVSEEQFAEFREVFQKSNRLTRKQVQIYKQFKNGKLFKTNKFVYWYRSDKKTKRDFYELKNGEYTKYYQYLRYENKKYVRSKGKEWTVRNVAITGIPAPARGEVSKLSQFAIGKTILNGEQVRLFSLYRVSKFGTTISFYDLKRWVSGKGLIIKSLGTSSEMHPDNVYSVMRTDYEYDSELKVVLPQISK